LISRLGSVALSEASVTRQFSVPKDTPWLMSRNKYGIVIDYQGLKVSYIGVVFKKH